MAIGSVSVEVVPDARGFHRKLSAELRDLEVKVNVNADTARAKAQLDRLGAERKSVIVHAKADTAVAAAKLDELARTRTASVKADVDKSSFRTADSAVAKTAGNMNLLLESAVALAPALIPATAALGALAGALVAPIASAGAGVGIFGIISGAALVKATKDAKAIADLNKKAAAASDPKAAAAFTKQADALTKSLPKAERAFLRARGSIGEGFNKLLKTSGANIFGPLTAGAQLLGKVLPRLSPITDAFGEAITGVINQLSKFSDSRGFASVVNFIATRGVSAFKQFVGITGNLAGGIGGLIKAFTPLGTTVLSSIERATGAFRRFGEAAGSGKSQGFQNFLDYVKRTGPQVGHTLVDIGRAVGKVVLALAPQGSTVLGVIDALAKAVAKMKPSQIAAVAVAVGALGIATGKFSGLKGLSLLVAGLSYAYSHSNAFRTLANDAGKLASALNNLPDVAKVIGGAGLLAGALAVRGGKGGGSGVGGVVSKALGGGVQKVFVVNMGKGGLPGSSLPGKGGAPAAEGAALSLGSKAGIAGIVASVVGYISLKYVKLNNGSLTQPKGALSGGKFGDLARNVKVPNISLGGGSAGGGGFGDLARSMDLSKLGKFVAGVATLKSGFATAGHEAKRTGGNVDFFGRSLDNSFKTSQKSQYTLSGLARATSKVGISTKDTAKMFRSLPKTVQTKILTPGALKSKADIRALGRQFGLTPKQIKSIVKLVGARDSKKQLDDNIKTAKALNRQNPKPHVEIQGTKDADAKMAKNTRGLRTLNTKTAKPKVILNDDASPKLQRISGLMGGLHSKTITFTTIHRDVRVGGGSGVSANPTHNATGGWIRGPGTGTSDSIPAYLSNGEFVVNAAAARQNAALLEAINGRGTTGNRMAAGGSVTGNSAPSTFAVNYNGPVYAHDPDELARKQAAKDRVAISMANF